MKNRRQNVRLSFMLEAWLGKGGVLERTDDQLCDLSIGGAHLESEQSYPLGSVLNLRFKLPQASDFITCAVAVRHTDGGRRHGVEFLDLSPDDRYRIKTFVEHQLISEALQRTRQSMFQSAAQPEPESEQGSRLPQGVMSGESIGEVWE